MSIIPRPSVGPGMRCGVGELQQVPSVCLSMRWSFERPSFSSSFGDLLQIGPDDREGPAVPRVELGSDAKERMNESALPDHIALRQPSDLPFSDQMHCLITIDGPQ